MFNSEIVLKKKLVKIATSKSEIPNLLRRIKYD